MLGQQPEANVPGDPRYLITVWKQIPGKNVRVSKEVKLGKERQEGGSLKMGRRGMIKENEVRAWETPNLE